jgi:hypothetical protein
MWLAFTVPILPFLLFVLPIRIVRYAITGDPDHRAAVKLPGKALDQLCNAAYFSGHPKETISSHAGRWLTQSPGDAPRWARVIAWLTDLFEDNHVFKAIEQPFLGQPLKSRD